VGVDDKDKEEMNLKINKINIIKKYDGKIFG
jgi:hypothetical protein